MARVFSVGVLGARGHVATELLPLLAAHPSLRVAALVSRSGIRTGVLDPGVAIEDLSPEQAAARRLDAWILGLPNGESARWVDALGEAALIDLSADHRFSSDWMYGLVELNRERLRGARRIANPGCYATGMQLALGPLVELLDGPATVFGVSGHSGAGTTPSPKNDPERLRDNLMPYGLVGHVHEREAARHLGHPVRFLPHVAPFFRGISLTISIDLLAATTADALRERLQAAWRDEPLVRVEEAAPEVRDVAGRHRVHIGGFAVDGRRAVLVCVLDNLLKGAATQALQNLLLALDLDERAAIERLS